MGMIQEFQNMDKERRAEVKQLQREVATMLSEADAFVKDLVKGSAQRRSEVATMLSEADAFVKDLARGSAERASEVATMLAETDAMVEDFAAQAPERKAGVAAIAKEAAAIVKEADTFVKDLAKGSAQRHIEVWGRALARKVAAPPVEELPKEVPAEAPVPAGELLRDSVFTYLAVHPGGTKLVELEGAFGVSRIEMAKVVRALIDDNLVEKRDLLYFAI